MPNFTCIRRMESLTPQGLFKPDTFLWSCHHSASISLPIKWFYSCYTFRSSASEHLILWRHVNFLSLSLMCVCLCVHCVLVRPRGHCYLSGLHDPLLAFYSLSTRAFSPVRHLVGLLSLSFVPASRVTHSLSFFYLLIPQPLFIRVYRPSPPFLYNSDRRAPILRVYPPPNTFAIMGLDLFVMSYIFRHV